jgi:hypothetical protein
MKAGHIARIIAPITAFIAGIVMETNNPYEPPKADLDDTIEPKSFVNKDMVRLASGQKFIIYSIGLYLVYLVASQAVTASLPMMLTTICGVTAFILGITGMVLITSGLRLPIIWRIVCFFSLVIPLFNFLALLMLNSRATKRLREAGYTVGFWGAKNG